MTAAIHMLPGLNASPQVFVERLREHAGKIKHIACVVQWSETIEGKPTEMTAAYSTSMGMGDAAWLKYVFDKDFPGDSTDGVTAPTERDPKEGA